jgi:hypothetical protein
MPPRTCRRFSRLALLPVLAVLGCGDVPSEKPTEGSASPSPASRFDPSTAGVVSGRVTWDGPLPDVPPFEVRSFIMAGEPGKDPLIAPNPNAPRIDPASRGVAGAVVFLRGVGATARPWDHPPVRVEMRDRSFHVVQGGADTRIGFVRRGEPVEMVSREQRFHVLHAGGAAFFSLTFPDPEKPRVRRLDAKGLVELTSAAGYYWMRAYLFVDDHPYYARTDAAGAFRIEGVPPGRYEVVCWLPSWREARHERDPETSLVTRLSFRPPLERARPLDLPSRGSVTADFTLTDGDFER